MDLGGYNASQTVKHYSQEILGKNKFGRTLEEVSEK